MFEERQSSLIFKVIASERKTGYSIWMVDRENPPGWEDFGHVRGSANECLAFIQEQRRRERGSRDSSVAGDDWLASAAGY
jgi:uncharacterized protein YbdZ (MbtH family)